MQFWGFLVLYRCVRVWNYINSHANSFIGDHKFRLYRFLKKNVDKKTVKQNSQMSSKEAAMLLLTWPWQRVEKQQGIRSLSNQQYDSVSLPAHCNQIKRIASFVEWRLSIIISITRDASKSRGGLLSTKLSRSVGQIFVPIRKCFVINCSSNFFSEAVLTAKLLFVFMANVWKWFE